MKILRICITNFKIEAFCKKANDLKYLDYFQLLRDSYLLYPNKFKYSIEKLGYGCFEVIVDFKWLQKKWCLENGCDFIENNWLVSSLSFQIMKYRPEIIYLDRVAFKIVPNDYIRNIKKQFSFVKIITGYWGAQISKNDSFEIFSGVDFVSCLDSHLQEQFSEKQIKSYIVGHSWDGYKLHSGIKENKVVFLGTTGYGFYDHEKRYHDLIYLLQHLDIKIWGYEFIHSKSKLFIKKIIRYFYKNFRKSIYKTLKFNLKLLSKNISNYINYAEENEFKDLDAWYYKEKSLQKLFPKKVFAPEFGMDYLSTISRSEIVFNRHVDQINHFGNMRCFEVTGVGSCLVTDRFDKMKHLFNDEEIVGYSSIEEAKEKINYLIENKAIAKAIAIKGQKRTQNEHTTWHRCEQFDQIIKKHVS
jgi:spore maturation protein CgeB